MYISKEFSNKTISYRETKLKNEIIAIRKVIAEIKQRKRNEKNWLARQDIRIELLQAELKLQYLKKELRELRRNK